MELRKQLGVVRSWLWLLVAGVLLAGRRGRLPRLEHLPKVYEGKVTLIVGQSIQVGQPGLQPTAREPAAVADLRRPRHDRPAAPAGHRRERPRDHAGRIQEADRRRGAARLEPSST